MQQQLNREAFERKISAVYDLLEVGNLKKALKEVLTLLEKPKLHPVEKLYYRIVKAYVLDKCSRRQEALIDVDDIIKELLEGSVSDQPLLEQMDTILQEMGCSERLLVVREKLAQKFPQDKQVAIRLFSLYTFQNEYQKMSGMASKIEKAFGEKEFGLYSIQALYMFSQSKGAPASTIDLAVMFVEKQRAVYQPSPPQYFLQLYVKILSAKGLYDKSLEYLHQNEQQFGMILDKRRLVCKLLKKKGDTNGLITELLGIVKDNQKLIQQSQNGDGYQSIYDIHEYIISLLVQAIDSENTALELLKSLDSGV